MQCITSRMSSLRIPSTNVSYFIQNAALLSSNVSHLTSHDFKYETIFVLSNIIYKRPFSISRSPFKNKEAQNEEGKTYMKKIFC